MRKVPMGVVKEGKPGKKSVQISGMKGSGGDAKSYAKHANNTIAQAMGKQMKQDGIPFNKGAFLKGLPPVRNGKTINE